MSLSGTFEASTPLGPALVISLVTTALAGLAAWALTVGPQAALDAAYRKETSFVRLREVSANFRLPRDFTQRYIRAETASINVAVRNLNTWTNFDGLDPESDQFLTVPADRRWTIRMNVTF